jgi:glutaminyl-tRNA synthetase
VITPSGLHPGLIQTQTIGKPGMTDSEKAPKSNFIRSLIDEDARTHKWDGRVVTRFPPEPNGYLHVGHAKAISISFGMAEEFGGVCNLRFDDTNPIREEQKYVEAIHEDIRWLGYDWGEHEYYASDYFEQLYEWACELIRLEKAYVCDLTAEDIRAYRGTLKEPGRESPFRNRTVEENLDLFEKMRSGEFPDGLRTLRAKIDMASPNINMRDPVMYRIMKVMHHRTGDTWPIYPTYDFTHGQSDSIEKITHSFCSLEFEDHRPLYNWYLETLNIYHPEQTEFARLNLKYTIMSKRKLLGLVEGGHVNGWDDPRMPTLCGLRRRGYPSEAIRDFCGRIGVSKANSIVDIALLEHCVREHLNPRVNRMMAVIRPLKVVLENYPAGHAEELEAINNPEDPDAGTRKIPFSRTLYIEREDFMENPPKKFFRLAPGREVRLRYAYFITCREIIRDDRGEIIELRCTYDPETSGGNAPDGRKVKATLHWVSADHAVDAEVRLYNPLFLAENPDKPSDPDSTWLDNINPDSLEILDGCKLEPALKDLSAGHRLQFERLGYFCVDPDSCEARPVFNRSVPLRDTWSRIQKQGQQKAS